MSVLLPETLVALRGARSMQPLFANQITSELFAAAHTRAALSVHKRTDGLYILVNSERPVAGRTLSVHSTVEAAHAALLTLSGTET